MKKKSTNNDQQLPFNKVYQPKIIEKSIYEYWEKNSFFKTNINKKQQNYSIVIPPPNITGNLHMGHALQHTIMDILIRYHRMQGKNTLWQTGTDHAGIATQIMMERKIAIEENKTRYDYNRNTFVEKILQWKTETINNISYQMKRLGDSVDWQRECFTMDENFSKAVKKAFIELYNSNLIYRGKKLVNWDIKLHTAISDLEIEKHEVNGYMWYIKYKLANNVKNINGDNYLLIATTRPETMFGDVAIAVNPNDTRYNKIIGKKIILPITNRLIPIISDIHVDMNKGTGCLKITPAHDFNDYKIAKLHNLPMINIIEYNGKIKKNAEIFNHDDNASVIFLPEIPNSYQGLELSEARIKIIKELKKLNLLVKSKPYKITTFISTRSNTKIEPMLTNQWFIHTKPLAEEAILAVKNGRIKFIPKNYENLYFSWMENIEDWCISRQLWWGHRIPAWYDKNGNIYVDYDENKIRLKNKINTNETLIQDEDVLDTWFSSALWCFASFGWPNKNNILTTFYPTNILVTGFDIIFFWVARMIMLSMYFIKNKNGRGKIPFKVIYVTGLICDELGKKMSKTKGNVIDPIDIIDGISLNDLVFKRTNNIMQSKLINLIKIKTTQKYPNGIQAYGADALRFTLTELASTERKIINLDINRLNNYRNFCNKLWNASRYVLTHAIKKNNYNKNIDISSCSIIDRWILTSLNKTIKLYRNALDNYQFDYAANILYKFTWNQFCDWYIELTKPIIYKNHKKELHVTVYILVNILENIVKLAHPIIPFITEKIWKTITLIKNIDHKFTIMYQPFPIFNKNHIFKKSYNDVEWIKEFIILIRNIRSEMNIKPNNILDILVKTSKKIIKRRIKENKKIIEQIGKINSIHIFNKHNTTSNIIITKFMEDLELSILLTQNINKEQELMRLEKDLLKVEKKIIYIENKLSNKYFIKTSSISIIENQKKQLENHLITKKKIIEQQNNIKTLK